MKGRSTKTVQLHLASYVGRQAIRTLSVQYGLQLIYHETKKINELLFTFFLFFWLKLLLLVIG